MWNVKTMINWLETIWKKIIGSVRLHFQGKRNVCVKKVFGWTFLESLGNKSTSHCRKSTTHCRKSTTHCRKSTTHCRKSTKKTNHLEYYFVFIFSWWFWKKHTITKITIPSHDITIMIAKITIPMCRSQYYIIITMNI